jgi:hypothetical protein
MVFPLLLSEPLRAGQSQVSLGLVGCFSSPNKPATFNKYIILALLAICQAFFDKLLGRVRVCWPLTLGIKN